MLWLQGGVRRDWRRIPTSKVDDNILQADVAASQESHEADREDKQVLQDPEIKHLFMQFQSIYQYHKID